MKTSKSLIIFVSGVLSSILVIGGVVFADIAPSFVDVKSDAYYADAVDQLYSSGVINGYDSSHFGPNDPVTRGQLVAILKRYDDQLLNAYRSGGVGDLVDVVCNGFKESDFSNENAKDNFKNICAQP